MVQVERKWNHRHEAEGTEVAPTSLMNANFQKSAVETTDE